MSPLELVLGFILLLIVVVGGVFLLAKFIGKNSGSKK